MAAVLGSAAVGMGAGVMAERSGYVAQALAALSEVLPAGVAESLGPARALVAGGLPGLAAVEGAAVVAGAKAAAPLAAAAGAVQASSSTGSRKTVVVVALLALGAGVTVHRVGVKGVKRAWRQARPARGRDTPARGAADWRAQLTTPLHCAGCGRRHRAGRCAGGCCSRGHQEPAAGRGERQADGCVPAAQCGKQSSATKPHSAL